MKILGAVKRVVDRNGKVRGKSDGRGVDVANVQMSVNPSGPSFRAAEPWVLRFSVADYWLEADLLQAAPEPGAAL